MKNVDYEEIAKYLAITTDKEILEKEGLGEYIPKRKITTGRKITIAYLCNKNNDDKWQKARQQTCEVN